MVGKNFDNKNKEFAFTSSNTKKSFGLSGPEAGKLFSDSTFLNGAFPAQLF